MRTRNGFTAFDSVLYRFLVRGDKGLNVHQLIGQQHFVIDNDLGYTRAHTKGIFSGLKAIQISLQQTIQRIFLEVFGGSVALTELQVNFPVFARVPNDAPEPKRL